MRRWGQPIAWGLIALLGGWGLHRAPQITDGFLWHAVDTCRYQVQGRLPFHNAPDLGLGDRLERIDYQVFCQRPPPPAEPGQLFLYEISRDQRQHLAFVEIRAYPTYGWPSTLRAWHGLLVASATLAIGFLLAFRAYWTLRRWQGLPIYPLYRLTVTLLSLLLLTSWLSSAYRVEEPGLTLGFLASQALLQLTYPKRHRWVWGVFYAAVLALGFYLAPRWLYALVSWCGLGFMRAWRQWLYGLVWLTWTLLLHPGLVLGLIALLGYESSLVQIFRLLSRSERLLYLVVGLSLGGVAGVFIPKWAGLSTGELIGLWGGLVLGSLVLLEAAERLLRFRRRWRLSRFLRDEAPLLWEAPDAGTLTERVQTILRAQLGIPWSTIVESSAPQRLWLARSGEAVPDKAWPSSGLEAAIPLSTPYWLLIGQASRSLDLEEIRWLGRFAQYVGLARRHLALYETAHEARLQALRHQLSPHFLFNALHTLQALIVEDPPLAEKVLIHVSQLLRRSLDLAKHVLVPLSEEISLLRDYLAIEKQRFGARLVIAWQVPDPPPEALIPPFALQTLVENVIKHVVTRRKEPTQLQICLEEEQGYLTIRILDDGPGPSLHSLSGGIGLSNLRSRLHQIYGAAATFVLSRRADGLTEARLSFPPLPPMPHLPGHSQNPAIAPS